MRTKVFSILALLCMTAASAWALTPRTGDEWDASTKTLTVNSDLEEDAYNAELVSGASEIEHVIIADNVTVIGVAAFFDCTGLTTVTIGNGVKTIGDGAFISCSSLTTVTIGSGVTSIGEEAFWGCKAVTDVYCYADPSALTWNEYDCNDFKDGAATQCHVPAEWLDAYQSKFNGVVNVTFVGDLQPQASGTGYSVGLKPGTVDAANWTAKVGDGDYQPLPLEGIAAGTPVSFKYTGLKKVKSVKAVKKPVVDLSTLTADYEAQNGVVLTGTLTGNYKISVADGATVTLRDATIAYGTSPSNGYAGITCPGDATLVLKGTSTVQSADANWPAIHIAPNKTLTISGEGTLNATAPNGPSSAIGAGSNHPCGNIVIENGTINASAIGGAGIGSGRNASCGNITISGGTVSATSSNFAGIGGAQGSNGRCGDITISGGNVTAVSNGNGAGIGSGTGAATCGVITISGNAIINATSSSAAGIGAGVSNSPCSAINILGGNITAKSKNSGAGIGAGLGNSSCGAITISGNATIVDASSEGTGIGAGVSNSSCGAITIDGGNITASSKYNAGIGTGQGTATCNGITINGGTINATSSYGVGIGSVSSQSCGAINITGGDITAEGAYAGIGAQSGSGTSVCSGINISNATVYAKGKEANYGCGIGISMQGVIGPITIADNVELTAIKATGAVKCIGKGYSSSNPTIGTITVGGTEYPDGIDANQADGVTFVYPVQETTITWNSSFIGSISRYPYDDASSVSQDGITASFSWGAGCQNRVIVIWSDPADQLTFSSTAGNISKIEIYCSDVTNMPEGQGWSYDGTKMTWEGTPASSVTLSGNSGSDVDININGISQIVFTIQQ